MRKNVRIFKGIVKDIAYIQSADNSEDEVKQD